MATTYYDYPATSGAGKAAIGAAVLAGVETPVSRAAGKTSAGNTMAASDGGTSRGAGKSGSPTDALHHAEAVSTQGAGKTAAADLLRIRQTLLTIGAGHIATLDLMAGHDVPTSRGAAHIAEIDTAVLHDAPTARGAAKSTGAGGVTLSEILTARAGGKSTGTDAAKGRDIPTTRGAGLSSLQLSRSIVETVFTRGGGTEAATDALTAHDAPRAIGAGKATVTTPVQFNVDDLVTNVRANAKVALPECRTFLEALPEQAYLQTLMGSLPFLVMLFGVPQPQDDGAVNDVKQKVPCDFLYVARRVGDGETDNSQAIRRSFKPLEAALLADYRQMAQTGIATCNGTNLTALPLQRFNEYTKYFGDIGQNLSCMVVGFDFIIQDSIVGDQ